MTTIFFGGSRSYSARSLVSNVVAAVLRSGASISTGCAIGADALVIGSVVGSGQAGRLSIFASFGPGGLGAWSGSAVALVAAAARSGAAVSWLSGGPVSVPLRARLVRRSAAALVGCSAAVFFLSGAGSPGSLRVAALAVAADLPVFAFCPVRPLALVGCAGEWQFVQFASKPCWSWVNAQSKLV
jgi:hypothetical protein